MKYVSPSPHLAMYTDLQGVLISGEKALVLGLEGLETHIFTQMESFCVYRFIPLSLLFSLNISCTPFHIDVPIFISYQYSIISYSN